MAARPTPPRTPTPVRSSTNVAATAPFLSSLYIYNPSLGQTDATVHEQLVFSHPTHPVVDAHANDTEAAAELDRQLRAIGLAQGIVQFARTFSPEAPVVTVRTQKGFTVPLEVEKGWWMLATVQMPRPAPADAIPPSVLCVMMLNVYRLQRLHSRTFKYLHDQSRAHLVSTITPHYRSFAENIDLSLCAHGIEGDFDTVRWSCHPLHERTQKSFLRWTREKKHRKTPEMIDLLVFRTANEVPSYEADQSGLVFAGIQDGALSPENIRDIALYVKTVDTDDPSTLPEPVNGESSAKRSVSLPGFTQSWDTVVQTSSSFISALSFGTVPAKRSPLAAPEDPPEPPKIEDKVARGRWIIGGDRGAKRIWLERSGDRAVPISLANARPDHFRESSGIQTPGEDNLVELDLSIYKFNEYLLVFLTIPTVNAPEPPQSILDPLISPSHPTRPTTPLTLKPFIILHDPMTYRLISTLPPVPVAPALAPSPSPFTFSSPAKRPAKRDPWPQEIALEIHTHLLHLRVQYPPKRKPSGLAPGKGGRGVREYTMKTPNFFIFRTLVPADERAVEDFAEGWYIVKNASGQGGLGRGDDAGGLEDIARAGCEKVREVWREMSFDTVESDDES